MRKRVCRPIIISVPQVSGVYLIEHILSNRKYVGFSKNIDKGVQHRVAQHFDSMERGKETCILLQDVWNFDPTPLHWRAELLEATVDGERERYWMEQFNMPNEHDFNIVRCMKGLKKNRRKGSRRA